MKEALRPADVPRIYGDVPPFMAVTHARRGIPDGTDAAIVGMPHDGIATFRGGATRRGPQEIRKFSLLFGRYSFDWDLDVFRHLAVVDAGDVDVVPGDNVESYARFEARLDAVLDAGAVPLSLGGDHGITYPAVRAVARHHGGPLGLIVFDTHLDLSESFGGDRLTRASPLLRICELDEVDPRRVVVIGARGPRNLPEWTPIYRELGISVFAMAQVERDGINAVARAALEIATEGGAGLYLSIDIDSLDPSTAPGTNSPEPGGLTAREAIHGLRVVAARGFLGCDVVEVSPDFDDRSGSTSVLAARLMAEALCCLAAARAGRHDAWRHAHDVVCGRNSHADEPQKGNAQT